MQQSPCNPDTVGLAGCLRSVATNRAATVRERVPAMQQTGAIPLPHGRGSERDFLYTLLSPIDGL